MSKGDGLYYSFFIAKNMFILSNVGKLVYAFKNN